MTTAADVSDDTGSDRRQQQLDNFDTSMEAAAMEALGVDASVEVMMDTTGGTSGGGGNVVEEEDDDAVLARMLGGSVGGGADDDDDDDDDGGGFGGMAQMNLNISVGAPVETNLEGGGDGGGGGGGPEDWIE